MATESALRYSKQLAMHLGHRGEFHAEVLGPRIVLSMGSCLLIPHEASLELRAEAETAEQLQQLEQVVGSHLERFGRRDDLTVQWHPVE
ncbi:DUF2218 domain-containing protein [Rhodococcus sp. NPDC059968]|uniref:DUF2218 domain-containing protein n=1 Tax=Rhodococcus sp. NPDC059968 TaxID=3347017 RepID=UPI003671B26D